MNSWYDCTWTYCVCPSLLTAEMDDPAVQQLAEAFARTIQHDRVMQS